MKELREFGIILAVALLANIINITTGIFIPSNVIAIIILFLFLYFRIIKVENVETTGEFLLKNLAFLFIPLGVSLMNYVDLLKSEIVGFMLVCIISTIITFFVTAKTVVLVKRMMR